MGETQRDASVRFPSRPPASSSAMPKLLLPSEWCQAQPLLLIAATLMVPPPAIANSDPWPRASIPTAYVAASLPPLSVANTAQEAIHPEMPTDPLNSPYPVPWNWVMATFAEFREGTNLEPRFYRSPALVSPDGQYAAYSRIQMQPGDQLHESRVSSVMFLENLQTGNLQTITASSPLADNPFTNSEEPYEPGAISILMPVSWSETGDRLLARQFEGMFSTSEASDYAVVWHRAENHTNTLSPTTIQYTNAVLLGWSTLEPQQVLFRAGNLGEEAWPLWAVDLDSKTVLANGDKPVVYGRRRTPVWTGPQARW